MELTGNTFFFQWEVDLIIWLQAHMGSFGTSLASFISAFGEELACVAVLGFLSTGAMTSASAASWA